LQKERTEIIKKNIIKKNKRLISKINLVEFVRTKTQLLKTASILSDFSNKVKSAQIGGETLTPESVQEIALEIGEIAAVANELATEIAEGVPAEEESRDALSTREEEPEQIEVAAEETEEEKKKRMEKTAANEEEDDKDKKIKNLEASMERMQRETKLAKLAPKYASLFPQSMHEAKMNEIINSKQSLGIVEAKIQEASDIISNKTMVKIASMNDSIYDNDTSDGDEINISSVI